MATFFKDGKTYMYCPQCGKEIEANARFCMYCGYINYENEDNSYLKKFDKKNKKKLKFNLKRGNTPVSTDKVVPSGEKSTLEKRYGIYRIIRDLVILIVLVVVCYYGYHFISDKQTKYINDSKEIVEYVKNNVVPCKDDYYYTFDENSNLKVKSPYFNHDYFGYVLIKNENGNTKYFIAISDGTFGIREVNIDNIKKSNVLPYFGFNIKDIPTTSC